MWNNVWDEMRTKFADFLHKLGNKIGKDACPVFVGYDLQVVGKTPIDVQCTKVITRNELEMMGSENISSMKGYVKRDIIRGIADRLYLDDLVDIQEDTDDFTGGIRFTGRIEVLTTR